MEAYGKLESHIEELHADGATLAALPSRTPEEEAQLQHISHAVEYLTQLSVEYNHPLNDDVIERSLEDAIHLGPATEDNSFPMELFMDYSEPTYRFNVGDIAWLDIGQQADQSRIWVRVVIVSRCVDMFDVFYQVAPYTEKSTIAQVLPLEYTEDQLSDVDPDPRSRLKVVR